MVGPSPRRLHRLVGIVALVMGVTACCSTADDGAEVRGASGSASGSGVAGAAPSGSASGPDRPPAAEAPGEARAPAGLEFQLSDCSYVGDSEATPAATLEVDISLYNIQAIPAQVPAGPVHVVGINRGFRTHSIVIARYDGDPADLPVDEDGAVDVTQLPPGAVVVEISEFGVGGICQAAFDLQPGRYVLYCYLVEDAETDDHRAHYAKGMHTTFAVT